MTLTPLMLFYGGRADSVALVTGTITESTSAGLFNAAWADCQIIPSVADCFDVLFTDASDAATSVGVGHTCYFHYDMGFGNPLDNTVAWTMRDSSGNPWLRLYGQAGFTQVLQYNSGTGGSPVWTTITGASTLALTTGAYNTLDFAVTVDAGGVHTVVCYQGGSAVFTKTFTQASMTNIAKVRMGQPTSATSGGYSQIMATQDLSTVAGHVKTIRATGAGTYSGWSGAYTDVNEAVTSDATFNQATANGLQQSYAMADITVPTGYAVKGLRHCFRVKNDGANSPLNVDSICRSGGADYVSGNLSGIGSGFGPVSKRYDVDPATGVAWTQSGVNAVELGFQSAA